MFPSRRHKNMGIIESVKEVVVVVVDRIISFRVLHIMGRQVSLQVHTYMIHWINDGEMLFEVPQCHLDILHRYLDLSFRDKSKTFIATPSPTRHTLLILR